MSRLQLHLLRLIRSERGMALPTALFAMIATFGLGSAAILSSIQAQRGTNRDSDSKNAIAAADAGASVALLRLNRFQSSLTEANPCIGPGGEPLAATGGWCPATPVQTVGGATYSYQVSAFAEDSPLSVVAVGTADGVSRRVQVGLISLNGDEVFGDERVIGEDTIEMEGTADIRTDIGTNGDVLTDGTTTICGNVRHGNGKSAPEPDCDGEVEEADRTLPPMTPPPNLATNNTNCRLEAEPVEGCIGIDTYTKQRTSTNPWDPETRSINVEQNATLTMGGKDYFVCGLFLMNGQLIMAESSKVRIFFDTPENCGLSDGDPQIIVAGNANIVSTGYKPSEDRYDVPGLYVLGSPDITTTVDLGGGSGVNELVLYAPYSDVEISGNATWIGMFAGKTLRLHGTPTVTSDPGMPPQDIFYTSLWERTHYVECSGAVASPPDASC